MTLGMMTVWILVLFSIISYYMVSYNQNLILGD